MKTRYTTNFNYLFNSLFKCKIAMKNGIYPFLSKAYFKGYFFLLLFLLPMLCAAQFAKSYCAATDNYFSKVIQDGTNYYVLGQVQSPTTNAIWFATVSRVDATGTLIWTLSLDIGSVWNDAVLTPTGDLLVVGATVGTRSDSRSLFARVSSTGSFVWTKIFDYPNEETVNKIVKNPVPTNATYPYYAVGKHAVVTGNSNDVVLFNLNDLGVFNFKKVYATVDDDNYANDLEVIPNGTGEMLISGKKGTLGAIYRINNAGTQLNSLLNGTSNNLNMAPISTGGLYSVSVNASGVVYLSKFSGTLFSPIWERILTGLTYVSQVAIDPTNTNHILVTGTMTIGSILRTVVCRFSDISNVVTLISVKYLDNGEPSYGFGSVTILSNGQLAYTDGRTIGGRMRAFMSSSADLTTSCMTKTTTITPTTLMTGYEGHVLTPVAFYDLIPPTTFAGTLVMWQAADVCPPVCTANAGPDVTICQGQCTTLTATGGPNYLWNTGATSASITVCPSVTTTYTVSVTVNGCTATDQVVVTVNPKPVITDGATTVCAGTSVNLNSLVTVTNGPIVTPIWHIGSLTGTVVTPSVTPSVTTTYFVEGANSFGCRDTAQVVVTVTICNNGGILVTKYNDLDCDGIRDTDPTTGQPTEPVLSGWNFTATHTSGSPTFSGTTNSSGQILFQNIPPGTYNVTETPKPGWLPTNPATGTKPVIVTSSGVVNVSFGNCSVCIPTATSDSICRAPIDVLFVLDNSGSVDPTEYNIMTAMVNNAITQINGAYSNAQYAVVHYGGPCGERLYREHNFQTATSLVLNRRFPANGGYNDDLNAALGNVLAALSSSPNPATVLPTGAKLNQRVGSNLLVVIFTDAWVNYATGSCTGSAMKPYTNSNILKQRPARITVVHLEPNLTAQNVNPVCAAIASPGGTYNTGVVDNNFYDSSVPGNRQYLPSGFGSSTINILPSLPKCDSLRVDCCDSLMVMPTTTTVGNTCCTSISIKNKVGVKIVKLEASLVASSGWQFQSGTVNAASGFNWAVLPSNQTISLGHNSGQLPLGTSNAALNYCLASNSPTASAIQTVVFTWYTVLPGARDTTVLCRDTVKTNCPRTAGQNCIALVDSSLRCNPDNPYEYIFTFKVQNFTGSAMNQVVMQGLPAGYGFVCCGGTVPLSIVGVPLSPFPLPNNAVSNTLTVTIVSPFPILSPTQICFKLGFVGDSSCCFGKDSVCVTLRPCCDPCAGIDAEPQVLASPVDGCCYKLDLKRTCRYRIFSKVETEVLSGAIFGYHALGGPDAALWTVMPGATPTKITYAPLSGYIGKDLVDDIIQFCLDSVSQIPQKVVVRWYTGLLPDERVLCTDTLTFNCNKDYQCLKVVPKIECLLDSGKYKLTMTVTNQSSIPFNATHFIVNVISPPSLQLQGGGVYPLIPSLPSTPGFNTTTVMTFITSTSGFPTTSPYIVLSYRLGFYNGGSFDTCCFDQIRDTILIPPCTNCKCGTYSGINYRPSQGGQQRFATCGDTLIATCGTPTFNWTLAGNFQCVGDSCPNTIQMSWILRGPTGVPTQTGSMTGPNFNIALPSAYFSTGGFYTLTLQAICGRDTCRCNFVVRAEGCPCCQNQAQFIQAVNNAVSIVVDNNLCKATVNIGNLPTCDVIQSIQWGDGTSSTGPFVAGAMPMHTYTGSGTYLLTMLAIERNPATNLICFEYQKRDTIRLSCDTCQCRGFEQMSFYNSTWSSLSRPAKCDSTYTLPCTAGGYFLFHGNFLCSAKACLSDSVSWSIGQGATKVASGTVVLSPMGGAPSGHFDILLNPAWFSSGATYTLSVTGKCGTKVCTCQIKFSFAPCPCPCPTLAMDVAKGFKVLGVTPVGCKKTFMPIGLCPNDQVTWTVTGIGNVGTTLGNAIQMVTFPASGLYQVCMTVTRLNPDGTICGKRTICRMVKVICPRPADPVDKVTHCERNSAAGNALKNGDFTEGVIAGHLGFGGSAQNWTQFPYTGDGFTIIESNTGASDGGHLELNGDKNNPVGVYQQITLPISTFTVLEYSAQNLTGSNLPAGTVVEFRLSNEATATSASQLIYRDTIPVDSLAWMRRTFSPRVSPDQTKRFLSISVVNNSTSEKSSIGIDNIEICASPTVGTEQVGTFGHFRIIPNPNTGTFTVELPTAATVGMRCRITDLTGRLLLEYPTETGNTSQTVKANTLSNGMYFLQIVSEGKVLAVEKFVKQ